MEESGNESRSLPKSELESGISITALEAPFLRLGDLGAAAGFLGAGAIFAFVGEAVPTDEARLFFLGRPRSLLGVSGG